MSSDSFLLLPRPWVRVDAAIVERDADLRYEDCCRVAGLTYVKGAVRNGAGEVVRRLAYWHQVVNAAATTLSSRELVTGPAATAGTATPS